MAIRPFLNQKNSNLKFGSLHRLESIHVSQSIEILVVDDDPLVRASYRAFFDNQDGFDIVGEAREGADGIEAYGRLSPDLALMDLQMPGIAGIEATAEICRKWPDACVLAMTTFGTSDYIVRALQAGAAGYLLKDVGGPGLLAGIRQAMNGDMPLSGRVRRELVEVVAEERTGLSAKPADVGLTEREEELLVWVAQGLTNQQIGARMFVSEGSVKQYLLNVGRKLQTRSRTSIVVRSIQLGLIDPFELPSSDD